MRIMKSLIEDDINLDENKNKDDRNETKLNP